MRKTEKPDADWKELFSFRRRYFGRTPLRPVHIKWKEVRDVRIYTSEYAVGCRSLAELAQYFQENHCYDYHILKDRAFCHDALIYWWDQVYDTMEFLATDGYWGSIFDVWFHQKLYLRCVVNKCEGFLQKMEYSHPELIKQESGIILGTLGTGRDFHAIDIPLTAADGRP